MKLRYFIAVLMGVLMVNPLFAHQQKEAYITLLFNERSSLIEVSHRFSLHDV